MEYSSSTVIKLSQDTFLQEALTLPLSFVWQIKKKNCKEITEYK